MRLKIFSIFVVVQMMSFALWTNLEGVKANQVEVHPVSSNLSASIVNKAKINSKLHFATRNMSKDKRFLNDIRQNQIETALKALPEEHVASVKNIVLDYDEKAHRGLGGNSLIILRAVNMDTEEMVGVLIHELAHNVDYAYLKNTDKKKLSPFMDGKMPLYESDPSLDFYRLSWKTNATLKKTVTNSDFVSGYAMSDPFEDFAESYAYYVLHNRDFKALAGTSKVLLEKYRFIKYQVFSGLEFDTGDGLVKTKQRPWDVTVLSYKIADLLG